MKNITLIHHGLPILCENVDFICRIEFGKKGTMKVVMKMYRSNQTGDIIVYKVDRYISSVCYYGSLNEMKHSIEHDMAQNVGLAQLETMGRSILHPAGQRGRKPKANRGKKKMQKI